MSRLTLLQHVSLFAGLSDRELEAVAECLEKHTLREGTIVFHQGSPGETLYIIESGKVRIFVLSDSGQEISVTVYGPGEVFGELSLLDGLPRSAGAIAMEKLQVFILHRDDFLSLLEKHPRLAQGVIATLSRRVRYTTEYAESLAFLDVNGRVARRLLDLADHHGVEKEGGTEIDLSLMQRDLASLVGATRERVNKVLGTFRDEGLIEMDGPAITIRDRRGLRRHIVY